MYDNFLEEYSGILYACEKPSRYIGGEYLSIKKNWNKTDVKVALAFPDKYEIGISNFGFKILYHILNNKDFILADRVYAPEKDFCELLVKEKKSLYSLDSKMPLKDFDFLGFALQYEMSYTTILKMLELSGIPVLSKDRNDDSPIILAGGPCAYNPCPLSPFIDLFLIGDGEDVFVEICEKYNSIKGNSRDCIIKELAKIEGVYSPLLNNKTKKRIAELKVQDHPVKSAIPHSVSVHDRATIEIRRGCGRLCRFCQSAHTNLPIRERKEEDIINLACQYVNNTGYDEYSLLSLSSNDHGKIESIIEKLSEKFKGTDIGVSLPSQRADKFSVKLAKLMMGVRKSTITIAPEAGSQRMRDIINKNLSEEQIVNAVLNCTKNGWDKIKFYFIIGLPFENYTDLDGIIELIKTINSKCMQNGLKLPKITCSISVFVPKPFTPFSVARQNTLEEINAKIEYLKSAKNDIKNVKFNFHNPRVSQLESLLTRGDSQISKFIYELFKNGSYLDSWEENIDYDLYNRIAESIGLNIEQSATREYSFDEKLPWDCLDVGLDLSWLKNEYEKAKNANTTIPCEIKCSNCGVCKNFNVKKILDN